MRIALPPPRRVREAAETFVLALLIAVVVAMATAGLGALIWLAIREPA